MLPSEMKLISAATEHSKVDLVCGDILLGTTKCISFESLSIVCKISVHKHE